MKRKLSGEIKVFPSPLGVSYFQIGILEWVLHMDRSVFPSPLGVSYFQINVIGLYPVVGMKAVSVPSRGILFPNSHQYQKWERKQHCLVSVPSRGILFPNGSIWSVRICRHGFRPLSGYLISKLNRINWYKTWFSVSVPSRGILFPNGNELEWQQFIEFRFRPLSGYLISK